VQELPSQSATGNCPRLASTGPTMQRRLKLAKEAFTGEGAWICVIFIGRSALDEGVRKAAVQAAECCSAWFSEDGNAQTSAHSRSPTYGIDRTQIEGAADRLRNLAVSFLRPNENIRSYRPLN